VKLLTELAPALLTGSPTWCNVSSGVTRNLYGAVRVG